MKYEDSALVSSLLAGSLLAPCMAVFLFPAQGPCVAVFTS